MSRPQVIPNSRIISEIDQFWAIYGMGPTWAELAAIVGYRSQGALRSRMNVLRKQGDVQWTRHRRSIKTV